MFRFAIDRKKRNLLIGGVVLLLLGAGYRFFDKRNYVNFAIGLELSQNFTRSRRSINIDTGLRDDRARLDLLGGITATWTLPIYAKSGRRIYYN